MTLADIEAMGTDTLTPWKEELLWRLYIKTHGRVTLARSDGPIEHGQAVAAAVQATRPPDLGEQELTNFLEGFPQRYLATVDSSRVYEHARLARDIHRDEVHLFLEPKGSVWELTVVTLDKPLLFSNICGVLAFFGVNILRGSAMTNSNAVVLDVFEFSDDEGAFGQTPGASGQLERLLQDVVAGRQDITVLLRDRHSGPLYGREPRRITPVVSFAAAHTRGTTLEITAQDAPGPHQPRDRAAWLQRGARADRDRGRHGRRRVPPDRGCGPAGGRGTARAVGGSRAHAGGRVRTLVLRRHPWARIT
jgi:[protein-PII] uridylyltransferase